jgi:hypothetical protein
VCSSISPLTTVTATLNNKFTWTVARSTELGPPTTAWPRATKIQLFRSTVDQQTTLWLVAEIDNTTIPTPTTVDILTDDQLKAKTYLPIKYSDESVCANRFELPPSDMGVVVQFQDRWFYSVYVDPRLLNSTAIPDPDRRNLVLYSERDEMESVPSEQNGLIIADSSEDCDQITGLMTHGDALYIFKTRHTYRLTYAVDPRLDGDWHTIATRGIVNQHCWGLYDDVAFALDQLGPWAMSGTGGVQEIGGAVRNYFRDGTVDFEKSYRFFVSVEPNQAVVRFHVAFTTDSGDEPKRAFAYSVENNTWWLETYPWGLGHSCRFEQDGRVRTIVGGPGGFLLLLADGYADSLTAGQNNLPIDWTYKSGMVAIPVTPPDEEGRISINQLTVSFKPTVGASTFDVGLYYDHESAPEALYPHSEGPASSAYGVTAFTVNMQSTQNILSHEPGYARIPIKTTADARAISYRYLSIELSGSQQNDEQVIHGFNLESVK